MLLRAFKSLTTDLENWLNWPFKIALASAVLPRPCRATTLEAAKWNILWWLISAVKPGYWPNLALPEEWIHLPKSQRSSKQMTLASNTSLDVPAR